MVQDEIQSYHWCKKQCSIHPIVIYCMKEKLEGSSFLCDWNRDVGFISQVIHQTVDHIKTHLFSSITKIYYFFDSCAWQYKNCKPFYNLCHPAEDFSISCIWKFFATSHGKSPCDSIVGTEKACGNCQFAEPGFQSYPFSWSNVQILSAFNAIKFVYITVEEMEQTRNKFADGFSVAATVPRTRSFHQIVPLSKSMVSMKRIYHDDDFALEFDILKSKKTYECMQIENVKISQILLCKYDELCWIGMVSEIDFLNYDFKIKFMHPIIPSRFYNRPNWDHPYLCFLDDNTTFLGRMHRWLKNSYLLEYFSPHFFHNHSFIDRHKFCSIQFFHFS